MDPLVTFSLAGTTQRYLLCLVSPTKLIIQVPGPVGNRGWGFSAKLDPVFEQAIPPSIFEGISLGSGEEGFFGYAIRDVPEGLKLQAPFPEYAHASVLLPIKGELWTYVHEVLNGTYTPKELVK